MEDEPSRLPSITRKLKQTLVLLNAEDCPRLPEIKNKCRNLINRLIARHQRRRRISSADFKYDPLSYALNFDEGGSSDDEYLSDPAPFRNFSSRIPVSPPLDSDEGGNSVLVEIG